MTEQELKKDRFKARHGCLTAYLLVLIIGNLIALGVYMLGGAAPDEDSDWLVFVYSIFALLDIVCAIAVFMWKKWGVWGLCAIAVTGFLISIIQGEFIIVSLLNLVVNLSLLFWMLNIGGKNRGWTQME
jgi:hypothetical protein